MDRTEPTKLRCLWKHCSIVTLYSENTMLSMTPSQETSRVEILRLVWKLPLLFKAHCRASLACGKYGIVKHGYKRSWEYFSDNNYFIRALGRIYCSHITGITIACRAVKGFENRLILTINVAITLKIAHIIIVLPKRETCMV